MSLESPHIISQLAPFEKIPQKRIHPMRTASRILSSSKPLDTSLRLKANPDVLTDAEQEEKSALAGIVSDWMVSTANEMRVLRPPFGLVYFKNGSNNDYSNNNIKVLKDPYLLGNPFSTFPLAINHTLADSLNQKLQQVFATPEGYEVTIYKRYMEFANRSGVMLDDPDGINYTVTTSNTGIRIMGDILSHLGGIDYTPLGRKPTLDELASAASNSTPLIAKLASFEKNVFNSIFSSIAEDGGIPKCLLVIENKGLMYFQIKDPTLKSALDELSEPAVREKVLREKRTGCPARMRFNGNKSAIETLWNWYIDYSVQVAKQTPTISR